MPDKKPWTADDMPDLSGKTIVVTGANSGIGLEAAREFARKHADVILACRDLGKARTAAADITASAPGAKVDVMELDLSNLASVRGFSDAFHLQRQALHVLCNNAGVMAIPYRQTADGFEMQFGTNHLGHFALTGLLLDRLLATDGAQGRQRRERSASLWLDPFRRSAMEERLPQVARIRAEQARQSAVHVGAAAQSGRRRQEIVVRRMPSRICRDQSASGGTEDVGIVDDGISDRVRQSAVRAERRDGRVADRVCRRSARCPRRRLLRTRRHGRAVGKSDEGRPQRGGSGQRGGSQGCGKFPSS